MKVWCHLSCVAMLVHWCYSCITERVRQNQVHVRLRCSCASLNPSDYFWKVSKPLLHFMTMLLYSGQWLTIPPPPQTHTHTHPWMQVRKSRATTRKEAGKREREEMPPLVCAGEGDGPWIIIKTLCYLFKKPWSQRCIHSCSQEAESCIDLQAATAKAAACYFSSFPPVCVSLSLRSWLISPCWMCAQYFPMVINPLSSCERACDFYGRYCSYS